MNESEDGSAKTNKEFAQKQIVVDVIDSSAAQSHLNPSLVNGQGSQLGGDGIIAQTTEQTNFAFPPVPRMNNEMLPDQLRRNLKASQDPMSPKLPLIFVPQIRLGQWRDHPRKRAESEVQLADSEDNILAKQKSDGLQTQYVAKFSPQKQTHKLQSNLSQNEAKGITQSLEVRPTQLLTYQQPKHEQRNMAQNFLTRQRSRIKSSFKEIDLLRHNTEQSVKLQSLYHQHVSGRSDSQMIEDKEKYNNLAAKQKAKLLLKFGKEFPEIMTSMNQINNSFASIWTKVMLLTFTYNYFTTFWFIGFPGFPDKDWFYWEVLAEIIYLIDFLVRFIFPRACKNSWEIMYLLHDRDKDVTFKLIKRGISSLPTSLILAAAMHKQPQKLASFWVACIRLIKLLRYVNFRDYFDPQTFSEGSETAFLFKIFEALYRFAMFMHFIIILFILPDRFQQGYGWFFVAGYYQYTAVARWQVYLDSTQYVVSNMSGMPFGNVVPLTNGEWISAIILSAAGHSIYLVYYADIAESTTQSNMQFMENRSTLAEMNKLAEVRHLPEKLRKKIRYYFKNLRIPFEELKRRKSLSKELPVCLKEEISLLVNHDLIQKVKFFSLCSSDFILKICRHLKPHICIVNEHVFYQDSLALRLYFINEGVCEVTDQNDKKFIKFLSKGAFFGEIGIFLTGKRTCSVIVRTTTVLHAIRKEPLQAILEEFPQQLTYLKQVGRQRLVEQTNNQADAEKEQILDQLNQLDPESTVFDFLDTIEQYSTLPKLRAEFAQNMEMLGRIQLIKVGSNYLATDDEEAKQYLDSVNFSQAEHFTNDMISSTLANREEKHTWWQTKDITPDQFLIIPFSPLFIAWNFLLTVVVIYDVIMIPLTTVFGFEMTNRFIIVDIFIYFFLACDMAFRAKTAITSPKQYCYDPVIVMQYYLNTWFWLDLFVTFPLCYLDLIKADIAPVYVAMARLPRLLKIFRLNEMLEIIKWNMDMRIEVVAIVQLFLLHGLLGVFFGCGHALIGGLYYNDHTARFNGLTLYNHMETRPYLAGILDSVAALTPWQKYQQFISFGMELTGCSPYGDIVPYAPWEQVWAVLQQTSVKILWAMIAAQSTSFFAQRCEQKAKHDKRRNNIVSWMQQNHTPVKLVTRYKDFEECMWDNFKGLEEEKILKQLPRSLKLEIRSCIMKTLIENWEAFPQVSPGTIETVISMLFIRVYPRFEYIITAGSVADEMYFIIKGVVEIRNQSNDLIATLKQGQNFGEMALLDDSTPLRSAHAISQTMVSLAVLTKENVNKLCNIFPSFAKQLATMIEQRKAMNRRLLAEEKEKKALLALSNRSAIKLGLEVIQELRESGWNSHEDKASSIKLSKDFIDANDKSLNESHPEPLAVVQEIFQEQQAQPELNLHSNSLGTPVEVQQLTSTNKDSFKPQPFRENVSKNEIKISVDLMSLIDQTHTDSQRNALQIRDDSLYKKGISRNIVFPIETLVEPGQNIQPQVEPVPPTVGDEAQKYESQQTHAADEENINFHQAEEDDICNKDSVRESEDDESNESYLEVRLDQIRKHRNSVAGHFKQMQEIQADLEVFNNFNFMRRVIKFCVTLLSFYNLAFIPLQFAFRIEFNGVYLALEILTILALICDIVFRISYTIKLQKLKKTQQILILEQQDRLLAADQHQVLKKLKSQYYEIVTDFIAAMPISAIVQSRRLYDPIGVVLLFNSLRLIVKARTVQKFWNFAQKYGINIVTVLQAIFYYYAVGHWFACALLAFTLHVPDHRANWLRRLPQPSPNPIRQTPSVFDDLTPVQVYNYALYLIVNTLSNLTVGDILPITLTEKMYFMFVIWCSTFIYNFVFVNMVLVVGNLMSGYHIEFFSQCNQIIEKIKSGKYQESTVSAVQEFYDYVWYRDRGVSVADLRKQLPPSLAHDLSISIHQHAIEKSLLFYNEQGDLDIPLTLSVFKRIEFKQFIPSDMVIKIGQLITETYILLEGEVRVYGYNNNELLGVLTKGSHFGLDLSDTFQDRDELNKFDPRLTTGWPMDFPSDNFENRSTVCLVANFEVLVGVLTKENRDHLYRAYPGFKQRMQYMNRSLFQLGKVSLENYTKSNQLKSTRQDLRNLQLNNIMLSSKETYNQIIEKNLGSPNNSTDLSVLIKNAMLSKPLFWMSIYNFGEFKSRLLESDMTGSLNYDSQRQSVHPENHRCFVVKRESKYMTVLQLVQLINLYFVGFFVPVTVSFTLPHNNIMIGLEIASLLIQFIFVLSKIRTPVIVNDRYSLRIGNVLHYYYYEGLVVDLFGLLPLNLVLGIALRPNYFKKTWALFLICLLRSARVVSVWRGLDLIDRLSIYLKTDNYYIVLVQAISVWFMLGHFTACGWYFLVNVLERNFKSTWILQQQLSDKLFIEQYIRTFYFVLNIGTGIGSGDMIPTNEVERFCFNIIVTVGDAFWSFGFGLLFIFWGLSRRMDHTKEIRNKINQLEELLEAYEVQKHNSKQILEKYIAYESYALYSPHLIDQQELLTELPSSVVKEVMMTANEDIFNTIFTNMSSYNLIRMLCFAIKGQIYVPDDYIISRGDSASEIYFIQEGTVFLVAQDKYTIAITLQKTEFFGEIEVISGARRLYFAQAASFCTLGVLSKDEFEKISDFFPQLRIAFELSSRKKQAVIEQYKVAKAINPFDEEKGRIMGTLLDNTYATDTSQEDGLISTERLQEKRMQRPRVLSNGNEEDLIGIMRRSRRLSDVEFPVNKR